MQFSMVLILKNCIAGIHWSNINSLFSISPEEWPEVDTLKGR